MSSKGGDSPQKSKSKKTGTLKRTFKKLFPGSPQTRQKHDRNLSQSYTDVDGIERGDNKPLIEDASTKNIDKLKKQQDHVCCAVNWFKHTVDKNTLVMLEKSASEVLKAISDLFNQLSQLSICPFQEQSSTLMSSHNQVYQSLAKLIRWADKLLIHGPSGNENSKIDDVTSAVCEGIRELVRLSIEKLKDKEARKAVTSPNTLKVDSNNRQHRSSLPEIPLTPKEKDTLSTPLSASTDLLDRVGLEDIPPPKPPLPKHRITPLIISNGNTYTGTPGAPALPVKRLSGPPALRSDTASESSEVWNNGYGSPSSPYDNVDQGYPSRSPSDSTASLHSRTEDSPSHSSSGRPSSLISAESTGMSQGVQADFPEYDSDYDYLDENYKPEHVVKSESSHQQAVSTTSHSVRSESSQGALQRFSEQSSFSKSESSWSKSESSWSKSESSVTAEKRVEKTATFMVSSSAVSATDNSAQSLLERLRQQSNLKCLPNYSFDPTTQQQTLSTDMSDVTDISTRNTLSDITWRHSYPPKPPIPDKKRQKSQYDNLQCNTTTTMSLSHDDVWQPQASMEAHLQMQRAGMIPTDGEEPPPLPVKKKQTINAYLGVLKSYTGEPGEENFKRRSFYEYVSNMEYERYYTQSEGREIALEESQRSVSPALGPPLPPKIKDSFHEDMRMRYNTSPEAAASAIVSVRKKAESMIEGKAAKESHRQQKQDKEDLPCSPTSKCSDSDAPVLDPAETNPLDLLNVSHLLIPKKEDEDGPNVRGGTPDVLIVHATGVSKKDFMLQEAFLTTYRTFIQPGELINKLLYRYNKFRPMSDRDCQRASKNAFFLLLRVADELIGQIEDHIIDILMELVFQLLCDGNLRLAIVLRDKLLAKVESNKKCAKTIKPLASLAVHLGRETLFDFHASELAEQMTFLDSELFQKIEIPEVLLWAKEQSDELSPNLTIFTDHFNKMSYWCRSLILLQDKAQEREKLLAKFIKIMKHLRRMNNFNSYLALLSALDSAPIRRLEWQKQTAADLQEYCILIDSSSSFKAYRAALAEAKPPCIPYLGLILQDITFINLGNPNTLESEGHKECVNFSKCWQQFTILDTMRMFKKIKYDLSPNERVIAFFNDFNDFLHEEAMWQLSEKIKPRGGKQKDPTD
ncbi:rap guanine nucleotide exchange factor 1-like [Glandiceps talaboti]